MPEFNRDDYPVRPSVVVPKTDPGVVRNADADIWAAANPVLDIGEPGIENDTRVYKVGDGVTAWNDLAAVSGGGGGGGGSVTLINNMTSPMWQGVVLTPNIPIEGGFRGGFVPVEPLFNESDTTFTLDGLFLVSNITAQCLFDFTVDFGETIAVADQGQDFSAELAVDDATMSVLHIGVPSTSTSYQQTVIANVFPGSLIDLRWGYLTEPTTEVSASILVSAMIVQE
jgi:hypothetical protein